MEAFESILILILIAILVYGTYSDNKKDLRERRKKDDLEAKVKEFTNFVLDQKISKKVKEDISKKFRDLFKF